MRESRYTRIESLVCDAARVLQKYLDVPFAFFGHSMGALVAFELARRLRGKYGLSPVHLFVSAHRAPHLPDPNPLICHLPDDELVAEIQRRYDGIPTEVTQASELLDYLLPVLRADLKMDETYTYSPERPFSCAITAFGGQQDTEVNYEQLAAWRDHTTASFKIKIFPGGHFFIQSSEAPMLEIISKELMASLVQA